MYQVSWKVLFRPSSDNKLASEYFLGPEPLTLPQLALSDESLGGKANWSDILQLLHLFGSSDPCQLSTVCIPWVTEPLPHTKSLVVLLLHNMSVSKQFCCKGWPNTHSPNRNICSVTSEGTNVWNPVALWLYVLFYWGSPLAPQDKAESPALVDWGLWYRQARLSGQIHPCFSQFWLQRLQLCPQSEGSPCCL